jgi:hypothetical protein
MTELSVDRLTLKLSGLSQAQGGRLAQRIVEGLGGCELEARRSSEWGAIRKTVTAGTGGNVDALADQIVAEIVRSLERTL